MDPVTAAGLGLAIVPLLISAVENYENIFRPFVLYSRYGKEVERFASQLKAQKTAFRNECHLLLSTVCERPQDVDDILRAPNHPLQEDAIMNQRLRGLLDSSYDTCVSTLKLINGTLQEIGDETKGFAHLLENKEEGKTKRFLFRQKLKISFSKSRLVGTINDLRHYNQDFCMISRQIKSLSGEDHSVKPNLSWPSNQSINRYHNIRRASGRLYDALSSALSCKLHTEHRANICLEVTDEKNAQCGASNVRFDLILAYPTAIAGGEKPLWLYVESAPDEGAWDDSLQSPCLDETSLSALTSSLYGVNRGMKPKSVSFALPRPCTKAKAAPSLAVTTDSASLVSQTTSQSFNLCTVQNLCLYFQKQLSHCPTLSRQSPPCMGYLQKTKTFKHYIYQVPGSPFPASNSTLDDALTMAQSSQTCIPVEDKLRMAKALALAVLQFNATPWLKDEWRSKDVHFFTPNDTLATSFFKPPYLTTRLLDSEKSPESIESNHRSLCFAPNSMLFSLGIILLELGFDAPIASLQQDGDLVNGIETPYTEFLVASRLKKVVGTKLGPRFERLVMKCLHCDFGLGSAELNNPGMQNAFFHDVVCELDTCLKAATIF